MTNKSSPTKAQNRKYTQEELVLAVLQSRKTATTDYLKDLGIKSPSAVTCKLKKLGHLIESKLIRDQTPGSPKGKPQAEYTLTTSSKSVNQTAICENSMMEEM